MIRFQFYAGAGSDPPLEMSGACLIGADSVPVRGDLKLSAGELRCEPRSKDPVGVSLLWPVAGFGLVQLQTTRLPPRGEPYHLHVELARHQLMRISLKREEWGLFDYPGMEPIAEQINLARDSFISALETSRDPRRAARLADESLSAGMSAAEKMSQFHANVFLNRRQQSGGFSKQFLGVALPSGPVRPAVMKPIADVFDFVRLPFVWREIQPTEHGAKYEQPEAWLKAAAAAKIAVRGGPLLNFGVQFVPDWMYIWENDFESIFDNARDHVERTVQRFGKQISSWIALSGIHGDNVFGFSFEQTMELTRMAASVTKQHAPRAQVILDLTQPWGEYFSRNHQSIPPLVYADMAAQSGIPFDAFGLQFIFGIASEGYHVRDLLQISSLIDKLANLGKPIHLTAVAAPSARIGAGGAQQGGEWHGPWTEALQAEWVSSFCEIALSKPYVESVCLQSLVDSPSAEIATGGVLREDLSPKPAYAKLGELRKRLQASGMK